MSFSLFTHFNIKRSEKVLWMGFGREDNGRRNNGGKNPGNP